MLIPKRLESGDTIAVISPAAPSPIEQLEAGEALLEGLGYRVKVMPNAANTAAYLAGGDTERLSDLHAAFTDPGIDGILCARGGYGCARLLPHIDFDLIKSNPKLLMGFSDVTVLLNVIQQKTGLVGLYSPMLTSNLINDDQAFTIENWQRVIRGEAVPYAIESKDAYQCFESGVAEGRLVVVNLTLLASLCGTPWAIDTTNTVVVIEDWKERYYTLDRQFTQLIQAGVLGPHCAGLLLADFSCEDEFDYPLAEQLQRLTKELGIPCGYGFTCGHGAQTATIPVGVQARFDSVLGQLTVLESPVQLA